MEDINSGINNLEENNVDNKKSKKDKLYTFEEMKHYTSEVVEREISKVKSKMNKKIKEGIELGMQDEIKKYNNTQEDFRKYKERINKKQAMAESKDKLREIINKSYPGFISNDFLEDVIKVSNIEEDEDGNLTYDTNALRIGKAFLDILDKQKKSLLKTKLEEAQGLTAQVQREGEIFQENIKNIQNYKNKTFDQLLVEEKTRRESK